MKHLWHLIDSRPWRSETKYRCALLLASLLSALTGFLFWLAIRGLALSGREWMICLIGYPVIGSWVAVFLYHSRHDFHNGRPAS